MSAKHEELDDSIEAIGDGKKYEVGYGRPPVTGRFKKGQSGNPSGRRRYTETGSQGQNIADAIRQIGVSEVTYYRWRQEYGGLKADQVKRLKQLEQENSRLRRAVSDLTLDKLILQEAARGNF